MRWTLAILLLCACGTRSLEMDDAGAVELDVVGSWEQCASTLVLDATGDAARVDHKRGCTTNGAWRLDGDALTIEWASTDCGDGAVGVETQRALRSSSGLTLVNEATGGASELAGASIDVAEWRLVSDAGRVTIARVVGTPGERFGSACYWSEDRECGGIFSCSGSIQQWLVESSGRFTATTTCGGDCPCASLLVGAQLEDGTIDATFDGVSCAGRIEGTVLGTPIE